MTATVKNYTAMILVDQSPKEASVARSTRKARNVVCLGLDRSLSDKSGLPIQYVEVAFVEKQASSSFSAGLSQDANFDHAIHRGAADAVGKLTLRSLTPYSA